MSHFDEQSLRFLRGLARNNKKPWFEAHRDEYEQHVKIPMAEFVAEMDMRFAKFAPEIEGDPKRSVFRIHRDVRFSSDKSPYKTHAACWFFHSGGSSKVGREAHGGGAGFYFHLQPGASMTGGGIWMPPRPALLRLRAAIAKDPRGFAKVAASPAIKKAFGALSTESALKRVPRGFDAEHPAAEWLKLQSFTVGAPLTDAEVTSKALTRTIEKRFAAMVPLVRWLNSAIGLEPAKAR